MQQVYFFLGIIFVILIPLALFICSIKENYLPYKKKNSVMTEAEKHFFFKLQQTYGDQYFVFPQINLDKLVQVTDKRNFYQFFNKINRKSVDFVLADKNTLETVKVIELDDYTHRKSSRILRDSKVNKLMEKIEIPIEHIN